MVKVVSLNSQEIMLTGSNGSTDVTGENMGWGDDE